MFTIPAPAVLLIRDKCPRRVGSHPISIQGQKLENNTDREARARIVRVVHVVGAIHVINVDVVGVVPACWPRLNKSKPKAVVLETGISADQNRVAHSELVPTAKIGAETSVWDSTAAPSTEAKGGLFALPSLFLL